LKNFVLLLLLANLLFLVWQHSRSPATEPGVFIANQSTSGAASEAESVPDPVASVGAVLGEGRITEIAAAVGKACVSIGPYDDFAAAASVRSTLETGEVQLAVREDVRQAFVGYWVQVRGIPDVDTERANLEVLRAARLGEAYAYEGEAGMNISIGVFEDLARAEAVKQQVEALGLAPDISRRNRDVTAYFIDVGLPAGTSQNELLRRFGANRVLQGSEAACPKPQEPLP
jgi:hypothetical protein